MILLHKLVDLLKLQIEVAESIDFIISEESLVKDLGLWVVPLAPAFLLSCSELALVLDGLSPAIVAVVGELSSIENLLILVVFYAEALALKLIHHASEYLPFGC